MKPFDDYPGQGREILGGPRDWTNCHWGYGLALMRHTGQTRCAYCGVSLVDDYYHWLLLTTDHAVPTSVGKQLHIPPTLMNDYINRVLSCAGCNGFRNVHSPKVPVPEGTTWTVDEFARFRDRVFEERLALVKRRREEEQGFFAGRPWAEPLAAGVRRRLLPPPI